MHEVEPHTFRPARGGLDWIYANKAGQQPEPLNVSAPVNGSVTLEFADTAGFGLHPGAGLILRHVMEYAPRLGLDSLIFASSADVEVADVTINASPGMGVLAFCTRNMTSHVRSRFLDT